VINRGPIDRGRERVYYIMQDKRQNAIEVDIFTDNFNNIDQLSHRK
jgi:hypothetical protein